MRSTLALLATLVAPVLALAQTSITDRLEKSPRHQEWVEVKRGDRVIHAFVVYPEVKDKALTVIVIHENRGLNDWARSVADRLAENGYIAIAPDLLSGAAPGGGRTKDFASQSAATEAIGKLKVPDIIADLNAVADYAKTIPSANGKLASAGFCWGGMQSWRVALARPDLTLANVFYGSPPPEADFTKIACPVYGYYGGSDSRINATLEKTSEGMKAAHKFFESVIYDGAGHAFMRSGEEEGSTPANKAAAEGGWKRLLELLAKAK
jgi:carboxymethylenebutenolidase